MNTLNRLLSKLFPHRDAIQLVWVSRHVHDESGCGDFK